MDLEKENDTLRKRIKELEEQISLLKANAEKPVKEEVFTESFPNFETKNSPLTSDQIKRYGRHLIMSEIGTKGKHFSYCNK